MNSHFPDIRSQTHHMHFSKLITQWNIYQSRSSKSFKSITYFLHEHINVSIFVGTYTLKIYTLINLFEKQF